MSFYDKYVELCAAANIYPSVAAEEMGFHKSTVSSWKRRGNTPSSLTVQTVAQYFNVPKSFFSETTEEKKKPVVVSVDEIKELPKDERLLLSYYRQMTAEERELIENMAKTIIKAK